MQQFPDPPPGAGHPPVSGGPAGTQPIPATTLDVGTIRPGQSTGLSTGDRTALIPVGGLDLPADDRTVLLSSGQSSRAQRIAAVGRRWAESLIDLTAANRLIYYRDLRSGTLDLAGADDNAFARLLTGQAQTVSQLFADPVARADALRRVRTVRARMRELAEERGLDAGYLVIGLATWSEPDRTPRAPVLLYQLRVDAVTVAENDFKIAVDPSPTINPVLEFRLARDHALELDGDELIDETPDRRIIPHEVLDRIATAAKEVPGFAISSQRLLGTFIYEKLPMVTDLENAGELLASSEVVAALAGDPAAARALSSTEVVDRGAPDTVPPADEFLVLDADSSQSYAVNAVIAGQHLVIKGPPGTGKSQTIANIIAALAAHGRTSLFVAEKRAAIDAVVDRLADVGLDDLVQNLHGPGTNRKQLAQAIATRLQRLADEHQPRLQDLDHALVTRRGRLAAHRNAMHEVRQPWGITAYDAQSRLIGLESAAATPVRWRGDVLAAMTGPVAAQLRDALAELARLGEFDRTTWTGAWDYTTVADRAQVPAVQSTVAEMAHETLPVAREGLRRVTIACGLPNPADLRSWRDLLNLVSDVALTLRDFDPAVFGGDLDTWINATGDRAWRRDHQVRLGWFARRRAAGQLRALWRAAGTAPSGATLHRRALAIAGQLAGWRAVTQPSAIPQVPAQIVAELPAALSRFAEVEEAVLTLTPALPGHPPALDVPTDVGLADLTTLDPEALQQRFDGLAVDQPGLVRAARRNELRAGLDGWQLRRLLDGLLARRADDTAAQQAFEHAWLSSILEHVGLDDAGYAAFDGMSLHIAAQEFRDADGAHVASAAARVRRAAAAHLVSVLDTHPEQQQLIRREATKKARHLPVREMFRRAPQVLTAVKPCWAMSPLLVSQVLPAQRIFDVVIFDEASQVEPVDGITAIMRGRQIVVAGDEHQLPPTRFFDRADAETSHAAAPTDGDAEGADDTPLTEDVESLLQSFATALPLAQVKHLAWHYRSRDERLIAFSNNHIYAPHGNALTTFPGMQASGSLRHVLAEQGAEVQAVVDLILAHAQQRPNESLGVITMGVAQAERVDSALRRALTGRPDLHPFFSDSRSEPFFVKNIERVQGDERDAIILSVGYGKSADGRMAYRFGPLNIAGGHRRLNVAVTRSKRRMTVVSSFSYAEMDPARLHGDGARLLRAYLEFAETGAVRGGSGPAAEQRLNAFEADVRDRLEQAGIPLVPRYGVSGLRIDFAAVHPRRPDEMVLAIETDGPSYQATATVRDRDRLRPEHLGRLGWRYHRIWSTDWFRDRTREIARLRAAYAEAVQAVDAGQAGTVELSAGTTESPRRPAPQRQGERPEFEPGQPISEYEPALLTAVVGWIESDGRLRTEEDLLDDAMQELGFSRRGPRIVAALRQAIIDARSTGR